MQHFHVIRWESVPLATGERISVPDVDFASLETATEATEVATQLSTDGTRCATYPCDQASCTLHAPRPVCVTLAATA